MCACVHIYPRPEKYTKRLSQRVPLRFWWLWKGACPAEILVVVLVALVVAFFFIVSRGLCRYFHYYLESHQSHQNHYQNLNENSLPSTNSYVGSRR